MFTKTVLNGLYYTKLDDLLAPFMRGIGGIWMLHRVNNSADEPFAPNSHLAISPEFLDMAILQFKMRGYQFVSMDEMAECVSSGLQDQAEQKMISVTLDDAYLDNLEQAAPVFRRHTVPYTIFVAPGFVDGTHTLWWEDIEKVIARNKKITFKIDGQAITLEASSIREKHRAFSTLLKCLCNDVSEDEQREIVAKLSSNSGHDAVGYVKSQIMNWKQLEQIAQDPLCTLGAHTMGHYAVAQLETARARAEMQESRLRLEHLTGQPTEHFAYPYGYASAAGPRDFALAKELGFKTAVTTRHGVVYAEDRANLHSLPRISINGNFQSLRYLRPLMSGVTTKLTRFGERLKAA